MDLDEALEAMPLIAILRGVRPDEAVDIGEALIEGGICVIEVPLNSPDPFVSIEIMARTFASRAIICAGTVTRAADVARLADVGARLVVAPNADAAVISAACARQLIPFPGCFTPSEAFTAINAGAQRLKLFPASTGGPAHLRALAAVLPPGVKVFAVGGVRDEAFAAWRDAGAAGIGLGSDLYQPGQTPEETHTRASRAVAAWRAVTAPAKGAH
jgi:2-dehydro-3-deoxyphosphogalactonate aldolase